MPKKFIVGIVLISAFAGAVSGVLATFYILNNSKSSKTEVATTDKLIKDFYYTENAVHVSPHTIRKRMDAGESNFVLVDVRSSQEYEKSHIIGAVNVPAYKDPNNSISLESEAAEKERILNSFRQLAENREVIVYCYSTPCMTGRKIGKLLAENGIYVKALGIGWNEWRYSWNLWNHDGETPTSFEDYIVSGKEPGIPKIKNSLSPCKVGELGC